MKKRSAVLYMFLFALLLSCKPKENMIYMSKDDISAEVSRAKFEGLKIREGDRLEILVSAFDDIAVRPFNRESMSQTGATGSSKESGGASSAAGQYVVNSQGQISFPVLGMIPVTGLTKEELKKDMEQRLRRYLTDPLVTITLSNFNFSVLGEVNGPGVKTSTTEKVNIFQAIALSGDLTVDANRTDIKLIRTDEETGVDRTISLDLTQASIVNSPYYYLQQNDILYIMPDRKKQISVNSRPVTDQIIRYGGVVLGLVTLVLTLVRK